MNIKKCNKCGKILENEDYFSFCDIEFNKKSKDETSIRIFLSNGDREDKFNLNESWTYYSDLDFCVECFKKEELYKYLEL